MQIKKEFEFECLTCHFFFMTLCKSLRKSVGGSASFFGLVSFVLSALLGGGGFSVMVEPLVGLN